MIPILLHAHTRALTKIKFNQEGDLLFTAAKDNSPNVWYSHNGERLGNFVGHNGAVWTVDVTSDSRIFASGSADNSARLWDVPTGKCLYVIETETAVRGLAFSMGDQSLALVTDATMGKPAMLLVYDIKKGEEGLKKPRLRLEFFDQKKKPTAIAWTDCNEHLLTGHQDGSLALWNPETGEKTLDSVDVHRDQIKDIQFSPDLTYFITASKDTTAKLFETATLACIKTYKTERPVNSASISPLRNEVCIAGGQEAIQVTTTSSRAGQFEARFFDQVEESELGRVRGHFGPINTLAYHPNGRGYASGGEDGYVRLHQFDPDYFKFNLHEGLSEPLIY